ncbi:hypothetical protein N7467_012329 [Penicillium canescens]|nr:hypothetical protein N7467_012329 [Penicillium canescens]
MAFGLFKHGLLAWITQIIFLAQLLVISQCHPFNNFSMPNDATETDMLSLSKRASMDEFTPVGRHYYVNIFLHQSCNDKIDGAGTWKEKFNHMNTVSGWAVGQAKKTVAAIERHEKEKIPTLSADERRLIDIFGYFYGTWDWADSAAKARAKERAIWLQGIAGAMDNILTKRKGNIYLVCDTKVWEVEKGNRRWKIKGLELGPRFPKTADDVCTMPETIDNPERPAWAFCTTAKLDITPADWITLCDDGLDNLKTSIKDKYAKGLSGTEGEYLQTVLKDVPQWLLLHEFTHGGEGFGQYTTGDYAYGTNDANLLAQRNKNKEIAPSQYPPLKNADSFAFWACGVYLKFCNWGTGKCVDPAVESKKRKRDD